VASEQSIEAAYIDMAASKIKLGPRRFKVVGSTPTDPIASIADNQFFVDDGTLRYNCLIRPVDPRTRPTPEGRWRHLPGT